MNEETKDKRNQTWVWGSISTRCVTSSLFQFVVTWRRGPSGGVHTRCGDKHTHLTFHQEDHNTLELTGGQFLQHVTLHTHLSHTHTHTIPKNSGPIRFTLPGDVSAPWFQTASCEQAGERQTKKTRLLTWGAGKNVDLSLKGQFTSVLGEVCPGTRFTETPQNQKTKNYQILDPPSSCKWCE